ncbi:MAG: signal recognition particle receptor subunit alpha [Marinilabiliales bacterium]|nr:signal recognition particle receptor subunit alpha [Marinilabiliales bacterium]
MALFGLFRKEEKEILDKGLVKTRENVFSRLTRAVAGKSKVDDEVLDNLEEVLVSSDVGVDTTLRIIDRVSKACGARQICEYLRAECHSARGDRRPPGREQQLPRTFHRALMPPCLQNHM